MKIDTKANRVTWNSLIDSLNGNEPIKVTIEMRINKVFIPINILLRPQLSRSLMDEFSIPLK